MGPIMWRIGFWIVVMVNVAYFYANLKYGNLGEVAQHVEGTRLSVMIMIFLASEAIIHTIGTVNKKIFEALNQGKKA